MQRYSFIDNLISQNNATISQENERWESKVARLKGFYRITDNNRNYFLQLLDKEDDLDSYLTSLTYYVYTGRKGLWIYREGDSFVPLCWHPNVMGQILIFPARGVGDSQILNNLMQAIPDPPSGVRLVRVKSNSDVSVVLNCIENTSVRSVSFIPVVEQILDWKYPVRISSTKNIVHMYGGAYMHTRNRLRQARKYNISTEKLLSHHMKKLENFIYRWAKSRSTNINEFVESIAPYRDILSVYEKGNARLDGLVFFVEDKIQAVVIWDISNSKMPIANMFVNLCDISYHGLSEFVIKAAAEALAFHGIDYINFGGSETQSLDQYKKKFISEFVVELLSIEAVIDDKFAYFVDSEKIEQYALPTALIS